MENQDLLEWIEPQGGCVCFPRIQENVVLHTNLFYKILLQKYGTYVGRGAWFEEDDRYMRIGYGWETSEKLVRGLGNIIRSISECRQ
jgi:aspartate/methionine/tyrosine aminotransferase